MKIFRSLGAALALSSLAMLSAAPAVAVPAVSTPPSNRLNWFGGYRSGNYYTMQVGGVSSLPMAANLQYFHPIYIYEPVTITALAINVTVLGSGGHATLGIYSAVLDRPSTLIATAGQVSTATATYVSATFGTPLVLQPGTYFLSAVLDVACSTASPPNNTYSHAPTLGGTNAQVLWQNAVVGWSAPLTYTTTLPTTPATLSTISAGSPNLPLVAFIVQ